MTDRSCQIKLRQKVFQLHVNQANSCCRAYPDSLSEYSAMDQLVAHWQQEQHQLSQGIALKNCESCWKDEDQGIPSYRQTVQHTSNSIEIHYSNLCNQMCSYCGPRYSSVWQENIAQQGIFREVSRSVQHNQQLILTPANEDFWIDQISHYIQHQPDNSVTIKLLGGEPLMQIRSLEKMLLLNSNKIASLLINTNLNPPRDKFLSWLLDVMPERLGFHVSLDATPEYNHLPRAGFDSAEFLKNLDLIRKHNCEIQILSVVSAVSVMDLPNFLVWLDKQSLKQTFYQINNPDCLHPKYLPIAVRQTILNQIGNRMPPWFESYLNQPSEMFDLKQREAYNYYSQYFDRAGINPAQEKNPLFVQYWTLLQERYK